MNLSRAISLKHVTVAALLCFVVGLLLLFSAICWAFWMSECRHNPNLKQLGLSLHMYAEESGSTNKYVPRLSSKPGCLVFESKGLYPNYISDPQILLSLADATSRETPPQNEAEYYFDHSSYFYLGYMVWDDATVEAFADAYTKRIGLGRPFETDLPAKPPQSVLRRIAYGVYPEEAPDGQSGNSEWEYLKHPLAEIPLLIERPCPYPGKYGLYLFGPIPLSKPVMGGCVLYVDGHTEFIPYPGKWPMTERTIKTLEGLSAAR